MARLLLGPKETSFLPSLFSPSPLSSFDYDSPLLGLLTPLSPSRAPRIAWRMKWLSSLYHLRLPRQALSLLRFIL